MKFKETLKKYLNRYFVDAMGSMAQGLFASLLIGTIIGTLAGYVGRVEALGWLANIPTQLYQALPFIITAIVLVVTSIRNKRGRSGLPAALGLNYFREER